MLEQRERERERERKREQGKAWCLLTSESKYVIFKELDLLLLKNRSSFLSQRALHFFYFLLSLVYQSIAAPDSLNLISISKQRAFKIYQIKHEVTVMSNGMNSKTKMLSKIQICNALILLFSFLPLFNQASD